MGTNGKAVEELLNKVAQASNGIDEKEESIINKFATDLTERFQKDLDKLAN